RKAGYSEGWGIGRHVIGSNYFYYVRDPWDSWAEFSFDIDFIGADHEWTAADHPPEDSLYVWGPPPHPEFIKNYEGRSQ
ncbi:MAG: metapyrocatechase, partial [Pseudomonadota bacterium]|nr:metapyrocatechase [Pseudomonadota bacterium]